MSDEAKIGKRVMPCKAWTSKGGKTVRDLSLFSWSDQLVVAASPEHAAALLSSRGVAPNLLADEVPQRLPDRELVELVDADEDGELTIPVERSARTVVRICGRPMILPEAY